MAAATCGQVKAIVKGVFGYILVPKYLIIENMRLGVFFRFMQASAIGFCVWTFVSSKMYNYYSTPEGGVTGFVMEAPSTASSGQAHCDNAYGSYKWGSFKPQGCAALPSAERYNTGTDNVFVPTFVHDDYVEAKAGAACGTSNFSDNSCNICGTYETGANAATMNSNCESNTTASACTSDTTNKCFVVGAYEKLTVKNALFQETCKCTVTRHFFVDNAEQTNLGFNHGYSAAQTATATSFQEGRTDKPGIEERTVVSANEVSTAKVTTVGGTDLLLHTRVRDRRTRSLKDGLSFKNDAQNSLPTATVGDWLGVASIDNGNSWDLNTRTSLQGTSGQENSLLRHTGARVVMDMVYENGEGTDPTCTVDVSVDADAPVFREEINYSSAYNAFNGTGTWRVRKAYGLKFVFAASGKFEFFDVVQAMQAIASVLVILELPAKIAMYLALFGLGLLSRIYYSVQSERLRIDRQFHGMVARMINSKHCFQEVSAGAKGLRQSLMQEAAASLENSRESNNPSPVAAGASGKKGDHSDSDQVHQTQETEIPMINSEGSHEAEAPGTPASNGAAVVEGEHAAAQLSEPHDAAPDMAHHHTAAGALMNGNEESSNNKVAVDDVKLKLVETPTKAADAALAVVNSNRSDNSLIDLLRRKSEGENPNKEILTYEGLLNEMVVAFDHLLEKKDKYGNIKEDEQRVLQFDELVTMAKIVYDGLDVDDEGGIELSEFVHAASSNEVMKVNDLVAFFDEQRTKGCLETIFDDTNIRVKQVPMEVGPDGKLRKAAMGVDMGFL